MTSSSDDNVDAVPMFISARLSHDILPLKGWLTALQHLHYCPTSLKTPRFGAQERA